ncbi:MAG TPA: prepilin-type N-terminal cleavage/methylation domain-containing protein [Verrucomicrobiae bacterium]|nr:prepilin-type N-terminal cleavage/methylation domain-containing protein [Verrucomicrobiae bacterium]
MPNDDGRMPVDSGDAGHCLSIENRRSKIENGFTLIEILVAVALLSLIVLALMTVFSSTQSAFRASITQTDVLEGGRNAMDMIAADVKEAAASGNANAINFSANTNIDFLSVYGQPLIQSLPASTMRRTNVLEDMFLLSRENQKWTAVGYKVVFTNTSPINGLYRFSWTTNIHSDPTMIYTIFQNARPAQMSHILDGVVDLRVRAYDTNGFWMTRASAGATFTNNIYFPPMVYGEGGFYMYSNTLPASVEIELGVLEDRALQRAGSIGSTLGQSNYLAGRAGQVHIFRQRVAIPNVDPAAY